MSEKRSEGEEQRRLLIRLSVLQTVPAIAGILIACVALYAALNEADAVRKQQQAAVWPHVQIDRANITTDADRGLTITVRNRGIGPARVKTARVLLDGQDTGYWNDLFESLVPELSGSIPRTDSRVGQSVIGPGEDVTVMDLSTALYSQFNLDEVETVASRDETEAVILALREALDADRLAMEVCYCSVFDDCWRVQNSEREPVPVEQCGAAIEDGY
ncbi:MAG: hypothetical protein AAGJ32_11070 [Pseudomonadota bacterium]